MFYFLFFRTSRAKVYMYTIPEREGERVHSRRERRQEMSKRLVVVDQSQSEQRQDGLELKRNHPNRRKRDKNNNGRQSKKLLYRERERERERENSLTFLISFSACFLSLQNLTPSHSGL